MLDNLRNFGRTWIAKVFLGLLVLAVAGFGLPSIFLDLNANTVARVGDKNIPAREFERLYRGQLNQFAAQTGQMPTAQQAMSFGLPGSVLGRLASDAAVDSLAARLNLGASEQRVAQLVRQDPSFAGALGAFDRSEFIAVLRQAGYTEAEYLDLQQRTAMREQVGAVFDGARLPDVARDIAHAYENDRRTIEYIELNPILFSVADEPSEEDLQQFFADNQAQFVTDETRRIRMLLLSPETLAEGIEISDAEIEAEYERTISQYTQPERRTVHQILLADDEAVEIFESGLAEDVDFETLLADAELEDQRSDLGTLARSQMTDTSLAAAAFGLAEGEFTIIDGPIGQRAVWVSEIAEGGEQPLSEVRDQIEQRLQLSQAQDQLLIAYDDIEEARAAFAPMDDVAAQYGLAIHDMELTRDGAALEEVAALPEGAESNIVEQVFATSETANITPAINLGSNRTVFFDLEEVFPVRERTLDEVREAVVAAWQEMEAELAIIEAAENMVSALETGSDLFAVAAEFGQVPQSSAPFDRSGAGDGSISAAVASAAFMGGEDHTGYAHTETGNILVFQVSGTVSGEDADDAQIAQMISEGFPDILYSNFVQGLRDDLGIRVNEQTLNRIIGLE